MPPLILIPLADDNEDRLITPYVTYLLIFFNLITFIILQDMDGASHFTRAFSTVPEEIVENKDLVTPNRYLVNLETKEEFLIPGLEETPIPVRWTLLTSMFMHAGWMHLIGNMLFLWIFGDNIEDDLGHFKYLAFYLLTGLLAALAHVFMNQTGEYTQVPCLGASGAISGVLGAYLINHPQRKVHMLFLFRFMVTVPAILALGVWFAMQMIGGIGSLDGEGGSIAYSAHIGGFVAGGILIFLFMPTKREGEPQTEPEDRIVLD